MLQHFTDLQLRLHEFIAKAARRDEGASAVEYGLLVALIAVVIIVAVSLLGQRVAERFQQVATSI